MTLKLKTSEELSTYFKFLKKDTLVFLKDLQEVEDIKAPQNEEKLPSNPPSSEQEEHSLEKTSSSNLFDVQSFTTFESKELSNGKKSAFNNLSFSSLDFMECVDCGVKLNIKNIAPLSFILCPKCEAKQITQVALKNYQVVSLLSSSSNRNIYKVYDTDIEEFLNLILFSDLVSQDNLKMEKLLLEASKTTLINHPQICSYYELGYAEHRGYIVTELVDSPSLHTLVLKTGVYEEKKVFELGWFLLRGLAQALKHGFLHGNINPYRVKTNQENEPLLTGLGYSMLLDHKTENASSNFSYIAPEKKEDLKLLSFFSDQYSLGKTLLYALTAKETPEVSPDQLEGIHPAFVDVLTKMTNPIPDLRYSNYQEIISAFELLEDSLGN